MFLFAIKTYQTKYKDYYNTMDKLKEKLKNNELTLGSWLTFSDPAIAEIMAKTGFDWLVIDMEHSGLSFHDVQQMIRVIDLCGVAPLVRVMKNDSDIIKKCMDIGAHGVIVPCVNSQEDAKKAVNAVKYPPLGTRGVGLSRAQNYSQDFESYRKWNQENSIVIVQIEHYRAVENLESIMRVDGVDGFIIGPYDLSGSLGIPGEFDNPKFKVVLEEIHDKSSLFGFLMGQHVVNPDSDQVYTLVKKGFKFIAFGVDFLFFSENVRIKTDKLKSKLMNN